tara:strand:+ start:180 stop:569 length:390 start_codon:yes stop_codon:yes gene_type:complete
MCNDHSENKPNIGHKYSLVYIKGDDLSECLGNECSSEYYICENKQLIGQIKGGFDEKKRKNKFINLELSTVVKVGMFEVKKIVLWGKNKSKFSIHGLPILSELWFDEDTIKIQEDINTLIKKYNWKLER